VTVERYDAPANTLEYVIAPGDILNVRVFQQEALSARTRVRADGRISLPLVNDWMAAGKTPVLLATELKQHLKGFINLPEVTVALEDPRPLSVSIIGEVVRPGPAVLESASAGVLNALAAAGGFTQFAHRDGIFVLRPRVGEAPVRIRFVYEALTRAEGRASAFRLLSGDVIVVE
jgi:polysaccharide export outer membrane protein